jgi:ankyrin repeat protein
MFSFKRGATEEEAKSFLGAVKEGNLDEVQHLLNKLDSTLAETKDDNGWRAVHFACALNFMEILQFLVKKHSIGIEAKTTKGCTPLHLACQNGHVDIVKYLVEKCKANIKAKNTFGSTALHHAARHGPVETLQFLVEHSRGVNVTESNNHGWTALHQASHNGHLEAVQYLVQGYGSGASNSTERQRGWASRRGPLSLPKISVDAQTMDGWTAVALACQNDHVDIVQYLIERGNANVINYRTRKQGWSLLHIACVQGHLQTVQYLMEHCRDDNENEAGLLECITREGWTAVHLAAQHGYIEIIHYLVNHCHANVEAVTADDAASTPLHVAMEENQAEMVRWLLEQGGANVEAVNSQGQTVLHLASLKYLVELVIYLVEQHGANIYAEDCTAAHHTPFSIAQQYHHHDVMAFFESKLEPPPLAARTAVAPVAQDTNVSDMAQATIVSGINDDTVSTATTSTTYVPTVNQVLRQQLLDAAAAGDLPKVERVCLQMGDHNDDIGEARDSDGNTALHLAAFCNHLDVVQFLVEQCGVNVETQTWAHGLTPLHMACQVHHERIVRYLVNYASIEATDFYGQTALHLACASGSKSLVEFLVRDCQANVWATNQKGETPLKFAQRHGHGDVIACLTPPESAYPTRHSQTRRVDRTSHDAVVASIGVETEPTDFAQFVESVRLQNQYLEEFFTDLDDVSSATTAPGAPFTAAERHALSLMIGSTCESQEEEAEKRAILADRELGEFYVLLARKLYCMISAFEVLSTGMVADGRTDSVQAITDQLLHERGTEGIRRTKIGVLLADILGWVTRNMAVVPFLDTAGCLCRLLLTMKDQRDRYLGAARVSDFATMVSIQQPNGDGLRCTVERFARLIVRARCGMPRPRFVESRDEFGKAKQFMLTLLGSSGDTPAKEQACKAADCCFAHLMMPSEGSSLCDMFLMGSTRDGVCFHEVLAAATLETTVEELRTLGRIDGGVDEPATGQRHRDGMNLPHQARTSETTTVTATSDVGGDPVRDSAASLNASNHDNSEELAKLQRQVDFLTKQLRSQGPNSSDAGGGLVFADHREQYNETLTELVSQGKEHSAQISLITENVPAILERLERLESNGSRDNNPQDAGRLPKTGR